MKKTLLYLAAVVVLTATFAACTPEIRTLPMGVVLSQSSVTLVPGATLTLTAVVMPDEATIKNLTWSSSNPYVASVVDGVVTAINEGIATITVTTNSGQKSAQCEIEVSYSVTGVVLDKISSLLPVGKSMKLTATVIPDEALDKTVTWTSSNPSVAEVVDGVVIAKTTGTVNISVVTTVGRRTAICSLKIVPESYRIMTLTLQVAGVVWFSMSGNGMVDIDWGDGSTVSTAFLSAYYSSLYCTYPYPATPHTVTIAGEEVANLHCNSFHITSIDVSDNTALTGLHCANNQLSSIDVRKNTALTVLDCSNNRLTNLDLSNNAALTELNCGINQIAHLEISNLPELTNLSIYNNPLTSMVLNNTGLISFQIYSSTIKNLVVSNNAVLTTLDCSGNQLTSLSVSNNPVLTNLYCRENQLTNLDVGNNTALTTLNCSYNLLTALALNSLFDMLHDHPGDKALYIGNNIGTNDPALDAGIAEAKGWNVIW